jgi:hypothetical protein
MQKLELFPFPSLILLVLLTDVLPRLVGYIKYGGGALFNLWSLSCLLSCSLAFVVNRYRGELGERRLFELHMDIADLQAHDHSIFFIGLTGYQGFHVVSAETSCWNLNELT